MHFLLSTQDTLPKKYFSQEEIEELPFTFGTLLVVVNGGVIERLLLISIDRDRVKTETELLLIDNEVAFSLSSLLLELLPPYVINLSRRRGKCCI